MTVHTMPQPDEMMHASGAGPHLHGELEVVVDGVEQGRHSQQAVVVSISDERPDGAVHWGPRTASALKRPGHTHTHTHYVSPTPSGTRHVSCCQGIRCVAHHALGCTACAQTKPGRTLILVNMPCGAPETHCCQ